ncbi:hypothetical protein E6R60_26600 [Streptomyces sp. A0642]|uniref:hypothetical protein n=1 Tax=Streptomyces sp. A0642 TaxID=2563100 RepID=UPI0010A1FF24|nr:hypothetical protein [Streptomyces sp. A0642]THA72503.1 hypothetical protein E6R60_26600 [Streptomyces sp. A0642]
MSTHIARDRAAELARRIWEEIWPHDENLPAHPRPRARVGKQRPADAYRLSPIDSTADVKPGDLLWVIDFNGNDFRDAHKLEALTAREVVRSAGYLARVLSTTAKFLKVHDALQRPQGGFGGTNLDALGEPAVRNPETTNLRMGVSTRLYARLGTVEEIRGRLAAHPAYGEWREAYADAVRERDEADAAHRAAEAEAEAVRAQLQAPIDTVNSIAGETLLKRTRGLYFDSVGEVKIVNEWLAEGDRLHVYLSGLAHSGRFSAEGALKIENAFKALEEGKARAAAYTEKREAIHVAEKAAAEQAKRDARAQSHADAVWSDLCSSEPGAALRVAPVTEGDVSVYRDPVAYVFHHAGRDVRVRLTDDKLYRVTIETGPNAGDSWAGENAETAVKDMLRALYGTRCPDEYTTGQDSCPGCDASAEEFDTRYRVRGAMPGPRPLHSQH